MDGMDGSGDRPAGDPGWDMLVEEWAGEGWCVAVERKFRPMFGAYFEVRADHGPTGRAIRFDAPNMRIAVKKMKARLGEDGG